MKSLLFMIALAITSLQAQSLYVVVESTTMQGASTTKQIITDEYLVTEMDNPMQGKQLFMFIYDDQALYQVDKTAKTLTKFDLDGMNAQLQQSAGMLGTFSLNATGKNKTVMKMDCKEYTLKNEGGMMAITGTLYMAEMPVLNHAKIKAALEYMVRMNPMAKAFYQPGKMAVEAELKMNMPNGMEMNVLSKAIAIEKTIPNRADYDALLGFAKK